jgi:dihydrodipicolinate synthase/N-acetylneuraminate lyase
MKAPLAGIVPPLITPLSDRDTLDVAGLERLIEHVVGGGVSGVFVLGTTGEGPSLGYRLRREHVERTCQLVQGRVPVLVGISDTAFMESVNLARHAAEAGAAAVVVAPPYYIPEGQPELQEYLRHLVAELPLPVLLYNLPALAKVPFDVETVRRAMDEPRIVGLKDSSGDMIYFHHVLGLLGQRPDWTLLIGPEEMLFDALLAGGHGGVSGGANLFPELYVQLVEAARTGELARARELHGLIMRVSGALYRIGHHPSSIIKGIKCSLACLGICDDFMAEPFHRFRALERALVEQRLDELLASLRPLGLSRRERSLAATQAKGE